MGCCDGKKNFEPEMTKKDFEEEEKSENKNLGKEMIKKDTEEEENREKKI